MYTLEQLQKKSLKELKEIGWELNVLPEDDRRLRQTWIDAIVGVNPPLLQLLSVSAASVEQVQELIIETVETAPGVEVEPVQDAPLDSKLGRIVYPRPAGAIVPVAKTSPGVEVDQVQESIKLALDEKLPSEEEARSMVSQYSISAALRKIRNAPPPARVFFPGQYVRIIEVIGCRNSQFCGFIGIVAEHYFNVWVWVELEGGDHKIVICKPEELELVELVVEESAAKQPIEVQRQESIVPAAETSPSVEVDHLPECVECFGDGYIEDESGLIKSCSCSCEPKLSRQKTQSAIAPAPEKLPGSRSKSSTAHQLLELFKSSAHIIEDSPGVKTEETVSESAIAPAVKISLDTDSDQNPILTGISLSDDEFRKAIALWDAEHPSTFDHCSDHLPSSVHCESSSVHCESSSVHSEPLELSLDSFCFWAPCPDDWYEPSKVSELSIGKSSSTSDFFIPVFAEGDRSNRSDEPPDTGGIFARLPKPKPPNFPPQASQQQVRSSQVKSGQVSQASRNYPEAIPKQFSRVAAGSSTQPARSPPGGDACLSK